MKIKKVCFNSNFFHFLILIMNLIKNKFNYEIEEQFLFIFLLHNYYDAYVVGNTV
jgi:hypothetical protein